MKITLADKRKFKVKKTDGSMYEGFAYGGFSENNAWTFTSTKDYPVKDGVLDYDPNNFVEITLRPKFGMDGKVRYQDIAK